MSLNHFIGSIGMGVIGLSAGYATLTIAAATLWRARRKDTHEMARPHGVDIHECDVPRLF